MYPLRLPSAPFGSDGFVMICTLAKLSLGSIRVRAPGQSFAVAFLRIAPCEGYPGLELIATATFTIQDFHRIDNAHVGRTYKTGAVNDRSRRRYLANSDSLSLTLTERLRR